MSGKPFLEMNHINKAFYGVTVLNDVRFELEKGEVHALLGENGAGKSTLMKILSGIYPMDSGEIFLRGEKVNIHSPGTARDLHISFIHQEICLVNEMTIAENIFLGTEQKKGRYFFDNAEMNLRAQHILDELGLGLDASTKVKYLSIAKQQMVEIAKSLIFNAEIIIMDEPTAALTDSEVESLFVQIERLKKKQVSVIYISHRLEEIYRICDKVTILRDSQFVATRKIEEITQDEMISLMVGRQLEELFEKIEFQVGAPVLEIKHFTNKYLKDVSFCLKRGEILGFAGLVGAGRTELARAIFGIDPLKGGEILIKGERVQIHSPADAIGHGIALVPEDRKVSGLVLKKSVSYNITLTVLKRFIRGIHIDRKKEQEIIDEYSRRLSIKMADTSQLCEFLSGGNQQKVVVSKWLATQADIIIFDEPTRGIDIGAKSDIYYLITDLVKQGISVILISSELPEVLNLSSRIAVMYEGRLMKILNNSAETGLTQKEVMKYATGCTTEKEG